MVRIVLLAALGITPAVSAQAPVPVVPPAAGGFQELPMLQNDLILRTGSDRIFYSGSEYAVPAAGRSTLTAQARWLIANPSVRAIVEGHVSDRDTRDHALALGARRAVAVRDFLVAQGVQPGRLIVTSMGKERPVVPLPGVPASGVSDRVVLVIVR
ncbi:OmpA family protein [Sphingomonas piscis]|uniref:OmpA family protein n=1 Tax=Sphingomonas piscis TaxID=2714943 RepID=A0A6G7YQ84_9SPHN|nr:OmpA family protein [Sphingomonas piscis]QIK78902.1 OmpA family protein [Sphingomonas piscis]